MLIVCVDDNQTMLDLTADILRLERSECEIHTFISAKQALGFIAESGCDVLLTDFSMPGMNGVELINEVKALDDTTYCILVTGSSPYALREHYPGDVFDGLLKKPYSYKELLSLLDVGVKAREKHKLNRKQGAIVSEPGDQVPSMTLESAIREARAFLSDVWDEADFAVSPLDLEYGCRQPAYFAVRVKEEMKRARRYGHSACVIKMDLTNLSQVKAEFGLAQDTDFAKMVLRSSDLVTYRNPRIFIFLPETNETGKTLIVNRLINGLRSRGILAAKDADSAGVIFSTQIYSFKEESAEELPRSQSDSMS